MIPGVVALRLLQLATIIQNRGMSLALSPIFQLSEVDGESLGSKAGFTQNSQKCTIASKGLSYVYMAQCNAM